MEVMLYLLAPLIILLLLGQHIALALLLSAFLGYYYLLGGALPGTIGITAFNLTYNFVLTAIPLFIFMGEIILRTGFSEKLYRGLSRWFQLIPGSLLHSNIGACGIFSAVFLDMAKPQASSTSSGMRSTGLITSQPIISSWACWWSLSP